MSNAAASAFACGDGVIRKYDGRVGTVEHVCPRTGRLTVRFNDGAHSNAHPNKYQARTR